MKLKRMILDQSTRKKRIHHYLENLEKDNYQTDPHADLKVNKKAPKFDDNTDGKLFSTVLKTLIIEIDNLAPKQRKKKKFHQRYRKDVQYLLEDEVTLRFD
ncbi:unnamed protein product [Dimorphilus gyrociliatus]|uniref:Uncharacterized protein n=1 Tax=Dimorphilus gyrociliatus TaxID=2664684 RepID=A0A7I8W5J0_9ANNE|nr:unnamed protein product [Dimorphilus gyrociliatus]